MTEEEKGFIIKDKRSFDDQGELKEERPDIVGVGDSESLYSHEAARVLYLAKEINPEVVTVAGGAHFSHLIEDCLLKYPIDFIVKGEGEYTLLELIKELQLARPNFKNIKGRNKLQL